MEKYVSIGFTKKGHGVKGEIKVKVEEEYLEDLLKASVVFLLVKGRQVPYFVEGKNVVNDLLIKFEEVDSKEATVQIASTEMFLRASDILKEEEREFEVESSLVFEKYLGFEIYDVTLGMIGKIEDIEEFPQQEMAVVTYQEKEILIPLHDGLIEKIDESNQQIFMDLPEGILDL